MGNALTAVRFDHVDVVFGQRAGVERSNLSFAFSESPRIEKCVTEKALEIDAVSGEHLADHVVYASAQIAAHLVQLLEKALKKPSLDRVLGKEIEDDARRVLANPMDAPHSLLQAHRIPRKVVIDHQMAELEVDSLSRGLGGNADLPIYL